MLRFGPSGGIGVAMIAHYPMIACARIESNGNGCRRYVTVAIAG